MSMLKDKTLILTGASRGIGRALAEILAYNGAHLVLNARGSDPENLESVAESCRSHGAQAEVVAGSAAWGDVARTCVTRAMQMGNFGGFIHAAGVLNPGPFLWELSEEGFTEIFDANVKGGFQILRHAIPIMRNQGHGLAVFFGSNASHITQPGIAAYCAAKAAEEHLARQLAAECPEVTTIIYRPGIVETRMQEQARAAEGGAAEFLHRVFVPWKERDQLMTPRETALALFNFINDAPHTRHGEVVDVQDLL